MNPRDKMPLEVTPIYYKLQRYDAAKVAAALHQPPRRLKRQRPQPAANRRRPLRHKPINLRRATLRRQTPAATAPPQQ